MLQRFLAELRWWYRQEFLQWFLQGFVYYFHKKILTEFLLKIQDFLKGNPRFNHDIFQRFSRLWCLKVFPPRIFQWFLQKEEFFPGFSRDTSWKFSRNYSTHFCRTSVMFQVILLEFLQDILKRFPPPLTPAAYYSGISSSKNSSRNSFRDSSRIF